MKYGEKRLSASTLLALQEAEQMISEYNNGTRTPPGFSNAKEMFAAMDLEDESEA